MADEKKITTPEEAVKFINKEYKSNGLLIGKQEEDVPKEYFSTGILSLDLILGKGGIGSGTIMEIYGPEGSGKSTVALFILSEIQRKGYTVGYLDVERAMDDDLARAYGVDWDNVIRLNPEVADDDSGEAILAKVEMLIASKQIKALVVDSVTALTPRAIIEGGYDEAHMGVQARMMSKALSKLVHIVAANDVILIFINQLRMKIGMMFGNPETTTGGNSLKFYAKYRLDVRRKEYIKDGDNIIGASTKVYVKKNKLAAPFRECYFDLIYGKGIDKYNELSNVALALGLITRSGAWFSYNDEQIGQGSKSVVEKLRTDEVFYKTIEEAVKNNKGSV